MDVFPSDNLASAPYVVHYPQRSNWRKRLLLLVFLCIPLLLLSGNAIASCSHDLTYTIPTSHISYDGECSSEQAAMDYCVALAAKHGYPSTYCGKGGTAATRFYVSGGWFRDLLNVRKTPFHWVLSYYTGPSVKPYKNQGAPACPDQCIGDPINVGTGNKFESRVEYASPDGTLQLSWTYNWLFSNSYALPASLIFGQKRTHYYGRSVMRMDSATPAVAWVSRPGGNSLRFSLSGESWLGSDGTGDVLRELRPDGIFVGWELTDAAGDVEVYDENGQLILLQPRNGNDQFLFYSSGLLARVEDEHGGKLVFEYNPSKLVSRVVLPDGNAIIFRYSSTLYLTEVEYSADSRIRYLYDEVGYVAGVNSAKGALTGVIDEADQRRSSTWYDSGNRAFATEEGSSGTQRSAAAYAPASTGTYVSSTNVALPSGHTRAMAFAPVNGIVLPTSTTTTCNGCIPSVTTYTYDSAGKPDVVTRDGVATDYDYDDSGRLIRKVEAANFVASRRTWVYRWNDSLPLLAERQLLDSSDAVVKRWTWQYNARGQAVEAAISDPASGLLRVVSSTYCEQDDVDAGSCPLAGLITSVDGSRTDLADVTQYVYYAADHVDCASFPYSCPYRRGDLEKVVGPLGHVVEYLRYDGGRRVLSVKDANGVITDMEYHPRGWLTARKVRGVDDASEADDRITRIEYEPTGLIRKTTLPDGSYTSFTYDAAHRLTDITDGEGNRIHYTLDNAGNKIREDTIGYNGTVMRTLSRVFNQLGQLQTSKDAYDRGTGFTYDVNGNTDTVADALGRVTDNAHDPLNRLTQTIQDLGGINATTQFEYDAQDNLTAVVDPKSLTTRYTYNGLGDLTNLSSPDTGATTYTYDSVGNRKTQTDARAELTIYEYDALNRLVSIGYSAPALNVTYSYDLSNAVCDTQERFPVGRLTALTDASGTTEYCYDRFGQLTRKVQNTNGTVLTLQYAYTSAGQLSGITYPDGTFVDFQRDALGRTTSVGVTPSGGVRQVLLHEATYYPFGPAAEWVFGNGRLFQRTLNQNYQPGIVQDAFPGGLSLGYEFDAVGNLSTLRNGNQTDPPQRLFGYDALNRLAEARDGTTGELLQGYTYDATGNRQSATAGALTTDYTTEAGSHRLSAVGAVPRSYDPAGSTTSIGGTARQFVYDAAGRMSQVLRDNAVAMNYRYNGKGEQVHRYLGTGNIYTMYDETGHWLGDYDTTGAPIQQAIWLDDLPVGVIAAGNLHYIEADHLGTPRVVIEPQRDVAVWQWELTGEAFGDSAPNQDPDGDASEFVFNLRFPGQRYDAASGLNYNYFRDYESGTGRYTQGDPLGQPGGLALYRYANGNSLSNEDFYGLTPNCRMEAEYDGGYGVTGETRRQAIARTTTRNCVPIPQLASPGPTDLIPDLKKLRSGRIPFGIPLTFGEFCRTIINSRYSVDQRLVMRVLNFEVCRECGKIISRTLISEVAAEKWHHLGFESELTEVTNYYPPPE